MVVRVEGTRSPRTSGRASACPTWPDRWDRCRSAGRSSSTRWHLDHHAELGSDEDNPKRHYLSPKINARWFKLLYCSPALFPIYFRAARLESASYPAALRQRIALERKVSIAAHLTVLALIWTLAGGAAAARAYLIPVFLHLPHRLHAEPASASTTTSNPTDPAKWGTLMRGHWFWDFAFLNSNYHLEHHYFAGVPFYRLPALQLGAGAVLRAASDALADYSGLIYGWLVENRAPHTNWSRESAERGSDVAVAASHVTAVESRPIRLHPPPPLTASAVRVGAPATIAELDLGKLKGELRQLGCRSTGSELYVADRRGQSECRKAPALRRRCCRRRGQAGRRAAAVGDRLLDDQIGSVCAGLALVDDRARAKAGEREGRYRFGTTG